MIICKTSVNGEQTTLNFATVEEMTAHHQYNDINYINFDDSNATFIPPLPPSLQILRFNNQKIFKLPPLPSTLHSLFGKSSRVSEFPDISACYELEDIDLNGSDVEVLDCVVPLSVKTIDLSFSRLRSINYEKIPEHVKIYASYCFLKQQPPESHRPKMVYDHNDIIYVPPPLPPRDPLERRFTRPQRPDRVNDILHIRNDKKGKRDVKVVGTGSQNVHEISIQKSATKSLEYVLEYVPKKPIDVDIATVVLKEYYKMAIKKSILRKLINITLPQIAQLGIFAPPIKDWCDDSSIHSNMGVTYKTLLKQVWGIIEDNHANKEAMREVLFQELNDSKGVCFTGRFTRTLNALCGFIEEVQIGLSPGEEMQNQIAMAIKRCRKDCSEEEFEATAKKEVKAILDSFDISPAEQEAWLMAVE